LKLKSKVASCRGYQALTDCFYGGGGGKMPGHCDASINTWAYCAVRKIVFLYLFYKVGFPNLSP